MRRIAIAWVRPIAWCNVHDIPWASHPGLGVSFDGCERDERYVKDTLLTEEIGEPDTALSHLVPCPGGEFLPEDAIVIEKDEATERLAALLWAMDAGGWSQLTSYQMADHETKEYWRLRARELFDALADQVGKPG